jgi:hypothetical protein
MDELCDYLFSFNYVGSGFHCLRSLFFFFSWNYIAMGTKTINGYLIGWQFNWSSYNDIQRHLAWFISAIMLSLVP